MDLLLAANGSRLWTFYKWRGSKYLGLSFYQYFCLTDSVSIALFSSPSISICALLSLNLSVNENSTGWYNFVTDAFFGWNMATICSIFIQKYSLHSLNCSVGVLVWQIGNFLLMLMEMLPLSKLLKWNQNSHHFWISGEFALVTWYRFILGSFLQSQGHPMMFAPRSVFAAFLYSTHLTWFRTFPITMQRADITSVSNLFSAHFLFVMPYAVRHWQREGCEYISRCSEIWQSHWFWCVWGSNLPHTIFNVTSSLVSCIFNLIVTTFFQISSAAERFSLGVRNPTAFLAGALVSAFL